MPFATNLKAETIGPCGGKYSGSGAADVNERGQVLVTYNQEYSDSASKVYIWENGQRTTLFSGVAMSAVFNDVGQIVWEHFGSGMMLWEAGVDIPLPPLEAPKINNRGQIIDTSAGRCLLWENGVTTILGTLGGGTSRAVDLNEACQIVGSANTSSGQAHAFLWENGVMTDLGTLGGDQSEASDINDCGQVTGNAKTSEGNWHAFLWENGVMTDLGTLGGQQSSARAINERRQVVGSSQTADGSTHAFLWQEGLMTDLGTLAGGESRAEAINDLGQVVGYSKNVCDVGEGCLVVWEDGRLRAKILGAGGGGFTAINNLGMIVGWTVSDSWTPCAALWTYDKCEINIEINSISMTVEGTAEIEFCPSCLGSSSTYFLETSEEPAGPWSFVPNAELLESGAGCYVLRVLADASLPGGFYRIREGVDADGDRVPDDLDGCPRDPAKSAPGNAGCGASGDQDSDGDTVPDSKDRCPGLDDQIDADQDGRPDCQAPPGMALIPAAEFQMGDAFGSDGWTNDELPVHTVYVSGFYMDRSEVAKALWDEVYAWAQAQGYGFDNAGLGRAAQHPVHTVTWYDAVKWCNARSEKENLTPCYYTSAEQTTVYRAGMLDLGGDWVNWEADGYRLPTETEWENASRAGLEGTRFPWGNTISYRQANYDNFHECTGGDPFPYDLGPEHWHHPDYAGGDYPYTSPVGSFAPNAYGLFDMAGNLSEWCWDWYDPGWYARPEASSVDSQGPEGGSKRVQRGGHWDDLPIGLRCASRSSRAPETGSIRTGFRCVRRQAPWDSDFDGDGAPDWEDLCPFDPAKLDSGDCGCGVPDEDSDLDGTFDCEDRCPLDPAKTLPGLCGCAIPDVDNDGDGLADCRDLCPEDPAKSGPGTCGCAVPDIDSDGDKVPDCTDACPGSDDRRDADWDGIADACDDLTDQDGDGVPDSSDVCSGADDHLDRDGNGLPDCREWKPTLKMAVIPAGAFEMGDPFSEGSSDERPVHAVHVGAFLVDRFEVTKGLWDEVRTWALTQGYSIDSVGRGKASNHPVDMVSWYNAAKWCNARSEKEGFTPCYYTSAAQTTVYRTGEVKMENPSVKWDADGYRLPTEAEWEKAARGGLLGRRFPWGYEITQALANYYAYAYHPTYDVDPRPYTSPVGSFPPNGYGLHDVAGNVCEWCWDWYDPDWYARSEASAGNPRGPASGYARVRRGGTWISGQGALRCASRDLYGVSESASNCGFRCVRADAGLDSDGDGIGDLFDGCPHDPLKTRPGCAGCGVPDSQDTDSDGTPDCVDLCPLDPDKTSPGRCGCGVPDPLCAECGLPDEDQDGDGVPLCLDQCPGSDDRQDADADGIPDGCEGLTPVNMVFISGGSFRMGDPLTDALSSERPVHIVQVSGFHLDQQEVTEYLWDAVYEWAMGHGYSIGNRAPGKGPIHPATGITWYDAVKWCNARSEAQGLMPVYLTQEGEVLRVGEIDLPNESVLWSSDGFRLPTEAEWEKAARGGLVGKRFPWGDTISHSQANYISSLLYSYDLGPTRGYHPDYDVGGFPYTSPVRMFAANAYGMYDMAGNVWEWCWDWYDAGWYERPEASALDSHGPAVGSQRVVRGGSWQRVAFNLKCASRQNSSPGNGAQYHGFRCARSAP